MPSEVAVSPGSLVTLPLGWPAAPQGPPPAPLPPGPREATEPQVIKSQEPGEDRRELFLFSSKTTAFE